MTKKQDALNKAKQSWKEIVKWWKELGTWAIHVVWWTTWALGYTLFSAGEKWVGMAFDEKWNEWWITKEKRKEYKDKAQKYSKKSEDHIVKAWHLGKKAVKWAWKVLKWWAKIVWHSLKWGYHLIDAWDKAIWEQIERKQLEKWRKTWKMSNFLRDNIIKLAIALSTLGIWWYKIADTIKDRQEDKQEIVNNSKERHLTKKQQEIKDFFESSNDILDLRGSWKKWEDKRENRYLWEDEAWNNMRNGFWIAERKKVIEWMCRMIESWHLDMVLKKADEVWVPRQCVFLALAESWWQAGANSWVAWWYRQFTEDSGKRFGVIDAKWNDYRSNPEKSTEAAMKHLKDNYKIVSNYNRQLWYNMSESDKRIFALHMYNGSPRLVKKWIIACKWNANKYSESQPNTENRNYVPRILGIQNALEKIFEENGYDIQKVKSIHLNQKIKKTEADLMYENFVEEKDLTREEIINKLNEIKSKYEEEYKEWIITKTYRDWAIRVINEAIPPKDEEDEEDED